MPILREKNRYYPGILQRLQHLIIQFPLYYLLVVAYGRIKTKEHFKLLALKVVAVAYERCSLTRGSQRRELAEKTFGILENWSLSNLIPSWSLRRGGRNRRFDCIAALKAATIYSIEKLSPSLSRFPIFPLSDKLVPNSKERVYILAWLLGNHSQLVSHKSCSHFAISWEFVYLVKQSWSLPHEAFHGDKTNLESSLKKQQELPLATMNVHPITTCVTICDYHDEKKKERERKKKKFVLISNADCFASA